MTFDWSSFLTIITALATTVFVVTAALWLKKLRQAVSSALGDAAGQQVRTAKRLAETIEQIQKNQHVLEQQIHTLALAHRQLRQDVQALASKTEPADADIRLAVPHNKTLH
jgi:predicted  nucleic acid-binding Zn-ribbon protein